MERTPQTEPTLKIRQAQVTDIPILIEHRRLMIEEMMQMEAVIFANPDWDAMDQSYKNKLERQLTDGNSIVYILEDQDGIAASGAVSIADMVPLPDDPNCETGYVHSIYTNKESRRQGYAKLIMEALIRDCKAHGIRRVQLKSSKAGLELYKKLGFKEIRTMSLLIE